jgi:hypothetical protein
MDVWRLKCIGAIYAAGGFSLTIVALGAVGLATAAGLVSRAQIRRTYDSRH